MRVEDVNDNPESWNEFTTVVFPNQEFSEYAQDAQVTRVSGGTEPVSRIINPVTLLMFTYGVIFGIPAAVGVFVLLFKKGVI